MRTALRITLLGALVAALFSASSGHGGSRRLRDQLLRGLRDLDEDGGRSTSWASHAL